MNASRRHYIKLPIKRSALLVIEFLEGRVTPAVKLVVPEAAAIDNATSFHTIVGALDASGLASGDSIEILPGANPGVITNGNLPGKTNITIFGHPAASPTDAVAITLNALIVDPANSGLAFRNLHLANIGGSLTVASNCSITMDHVVFDNYFSGSGISLVSAKNVSITASTINDLSGATLGSGATISDAPFLSNHVFTGNTFTSTANRPMLDFSSNTRFSGTETVSGNLFVGRAVGADIISVDQHIDGLAIRGNTFTGRARSAIRVGGDCNVTIDRNTLDLQAVSGISLVGGSAGPSSATISGNIVRTNGGSTGLFVDTTTGAANARVEGNDFCLNMTGVRVDGDSVSGVDLGGGALESKGGNNFRGFLGNNSNFVAVLANGGAGETISARNNLFAVADPSSVIVDKNDNSSEAAVDTAGALTGNAAYVQALYVRFLRRPGNVTNPADAGAWVNLLNSGTPAGTVANAIIRSAEAYGLVVDDLYLNFLQRGADAAGRVTFVDQLAAGTTLEVLRVQFMGSQEYLNYHPTSASFVSGIFAQVLGRAATDADVATWSAQLNSIGRLGVANQISGSPEAHARAINKDYVDLLHRGTAPSQAEINGWVATGLDEISIEVAFASSAEFQAKG